MPRMQLLGRHYHIASDAVTVPAFCMALGRLVWSAVVLGLFMHLQYLLESCSRPGVVDSFVGLSITLFLAMMLVELAIVAASQRGSIVHTQSRKAVGLLVVVHTCMGGLQLIVAMLGLAILSDPKHLVMCESMTLQNRVDLIVALIAISQLADVSMKACCCAMLVGQPVDEEEEHPLRHFEHHESLVSYSIAEDRWRGRCSFLCTCLRYTTCHLLSSGVASGPEAGDMGDMEVVARVMADLFHSEGFLDVLPSDILAGFVLLRHVQKAQEHEMVSRRDSELLDAEERVLMQQLEEGGTAAAAAEAATTTVSGAAASGTSTTPGVNPRIRFQCGHYLVKNALSREDPEDRNVLEEGTHFEAYALALYTWMMYTYAKTPCYAFPALGARRLFRMPHGARSNVHGDIGAVLGDNWFRAHEAGLWEWLKGREGCELAYATFINTLYERPYAIFVDHKWQCVVVAIRGTLSLEDLLNDAHAEPGPLDAMGQAWGFPGEGEHGHVGMANAADCIAKDLYKHQILHRLIQRDRGDSPPASPHTPLTKSSKGYGLRVVGHSLGAGAAVFLALMLRRDFPDLRCLAYCTPGGLLSQRLAEYTKTFTLTFVLGRDLVPRLTLDAVRGLRDDILRLLARCRANKNTVLRSVMDKDSRAAVERLLYPSQEVPPSDFLTQLRAYEEQMRQVDRRITQVRMVPPGRIIHFVKSHKMPREGWNGCGGRGTKQCYTPVWAVPEDLSEIYVSSTMALEHFPHILLENMRNVCEEWGIAIT
eukprot:evm.model.NODE_11137_length_18060_cov_18.830564.2